MSDEKDPVLAGVGKPSEPPAPVVLMSVFSPGAPLPVPPERGDRFGDDERLGFYPVG